MDCWEDTETRQFFADTYCAQPLNAAEVLTYQTLAAGPSIAVNGFTQKESATYSGNNYRLNWLAETSYGNTQKDTRYAEFTITEKHVENARLKWYKDFGDYRFGKFTVNVYLNGTLVSTVNQNNNETLEGIFDVALPAMKQGDVVRFETQKPSPANWSGTVTMAACLEYTVTTTHAQGLPTVRTVGYTQDCIEHHPTGKWYAADTHEELNTARIITYIGVPIQSVCLTFLI